MPAQTHDPALRAPSGLGSLVLLAIGCGFPQSNALDLPRTEGVPVEVKNVRMSESMTAVLGSSTFSGSDPNAIGVAYDVHVLDSAPEYAGVSARLACRVGNHTVVEPFYPDSGNRIASSKPGTKFEERTTFIPTRLSEGIPKVCEAELVYAIMPPISVEPPSGPSSPQRETRNLGTMCFSDGRLTEGPCAADVLPRTPAPIPVEVSQLVGSIGPLAGGGHGLALTVLATAGDDVPRQFFVGATASCEVAGETKTLPVGLLMIGIDLRPGESTIMFTATSQNDALPTEPTWCTVQVQAAEQGQRRALADFCVRGQTTTPGACAS